MQLAAFSEQWVGLDEIREELGAELPRNSSKRARTCPGARPSASPSTRPQNRPAFEGRLESEVSHAALLCPDAQHSRSVEASAVTRTAPCLYRYSTPTLTTWAAEDFHLTDVEGHQQRGAETGGTIDDVDAGPGGSAFWAGSLGRTPTLLRCARIDTDLLVSCTCFDRCHRRTSQ